MQSTLRSMHIDMCNLYRIAIWYCDVTVRYTPRFARPNLWRRARKRHMYVRICNVYMYICDVYTYTWRYTCSIDFANTNYFPLAPSAPLPPLCSAAGGGPRDTTGKGFDEARGRWPRSKYDDVKSIKRANSRYCKTMYTARLAWLPLNCSSFPDEYRALWPVICMVNPLTMSTCVHYAHEGEFRITAMRSVCMLEHLFHTSTT